MKKLLFIPAIVLFSACGNNNSGTKSETATKDTTLHYFGDSITIEGAVAADQLSTMMKGKDSMKVKLTGTIEAVCQKRAVG